MSFIEFEKNLIKSIENVKNDNIRVKKPKYSTKTKALGKSFLFFIISIGICSSPEADKNLDNATDKVEKKNIRNILLMVDFLQLKLKISL